MYWIAHIFAFKTLENINENGGFFVTRTKANTKYRIIRKNAGSSKTIIRDAVVSFTGPKADDYSGSLRLVQYKNPDDGKVYEYITNDMNLSACTIASIYKSRWDIELFFKWMKQNMKMKSFIGTSENAVRIQIWTAAIVFLLIAYIKFLLKVLLSFTEIFRILGSNLFSDRSMYDLLSGQIRPKPCRVKGFDIQLDLGL